MQNAESGQSEDAIASYAVAPQLPQTSLIMISTQHMASSLPYGVEVFVSGVSGNYGETQAIHLT